MASLTDRNPDRINLTEPLSSGQRVGCRFTFLPAGRRENEPGVKYVTVTSPTNTEGWRAVMWQCRDPAAYVVLKERDLTPEEIKHFERRLEALKPSKIDP